MAEQERVIVVGGGASGMMAAGTAAERGHRVLLLEKNRSLGRKLRITGKGRCNLTNLTDVEGLVEHLPGNGRFLRSAFYRFGPEDLIAFFTAWGLETKVERGNRVFPASDEAADVVTALERFLRAGHVEVWKESPVSRLLVEAGAIRGVQLRNGTELSAAAVILATGGASYPGTGSTGDGYCMACEVGHTIEPIRPSLVPLEVAEAWVPPLAGLTLKNVDLYALSPEGKILWHERGEMLFTHFGVSGPLVLSASRHLVGCTGCRLRIDLKPALTEEVLDARVQRDFHEAIRRQIGNALDKLLPRALIPVVLHVAGLPEDLPVHQVTRKQRHALVRVLKGLMLTVTRPRPLAEAIVTAGGVSTHEIDARTMASRVVDGLYLTGEVIDVDGYTGGYNLQAAFTTGRIAGESV
ncbi:MAG TPA: NAD(P)/FAD-dependent oxidoreductase [Armatimonadota bacterium]|jgi:predicted Rossmann fold flavoprotein|nr:NAD(P)/FAD-dependent oxidoreductase [Armatimonadota bacterium]HOM82931.1 NAD(P)/FAD-dependent oxidoreductase [Armatimonadota bacterium]HPO73222.1 NAD(P)/FAD-dependent oxidoreductase [Armatimonadota bacterium]HPT98693.1 NAD(P)/FAD-dependent oxidoreductase [Armatimonadota bacterium]